ncbi:TspO/MBR family protein [Aliterella atlantica]|uniref:TspO/MBR-like protein n=1 Tax=Aliterella atlantica CENA595 TaxID=1618023 RepID=A0A0D8ZLZ1_9CYAN|nr:TspO/MBR family protein [Aliterella atlantica]KJH69745.1 TspO/MBR-like protein [Aliterella atlantica CENA595]
MIQSWMVIAAVTALVAVGGVLFKPRDLKWAIGLRRPKWLTFEPLIPVIWTAIFICGAWSANIVWQQNPGSTKIWLLMSLYLLLEIVTVSYTSVTLRLRSLQVGTILGGSGAVLSIILALAVFPISRLAAGLLLPYIIWSPVGTYTTEEMIQLNPGAE